MVFEQSGGGAKAVPKFLNGFTIKASKIKKNRTALRLADGLLV